MGNNGYDSRILAGVIVAGITAVTGLVWGFCMRYWYRKKLFELCSRIKEGHRESVNVLTTNFEKALYVRSMYCDGSTPNEGISFTYPKPFPITDIDDYYNKSNLCLNESTKQAFGAVITLIEGMGLRKATADSAFRNKKWNEFKCAYRQYMKDWIYCYSQLSKLSVSKNKYVPLNKDVTDFNSNLAKKLGIELDEGAALRDYHKRVGTKFTDTGDVLS